MSRGAIRHYFGMLQFEIMTVVCDGHGCAVYVAAVSFLAENETIERIPFTEVYSKNKQILIIHILNDISLYILPSFLSH